ncbi:hypothetical protein [Halorientalis pallida]|jgi:hypothetical protein|uniref:Uncharacterized protein n=1 Tax=Halorientalis pallida TaxID=2479928 RepID=A0A498L381_9EURY|nr:hypothetical protein [Halorientalis pallida]RXK51771.1 hypothetical protein EAF64_03820 [Halorientalis pallida]
MIRREFLAGLGASVGVIYAGCLSPSSTQTEEFTPDVEPTKRLGQAPGISFDAKPQEEYEYLEESDSVRIQYESGESSTFAFAWWGTARAAEHGADRLKRLLEDKSLTGTGISTGWGETELAAIDVPTDEDPPTQEEFKRGPPLCPKVRHLHHYARDGSLISKPDVSFSRIVEATPRSMEITMLFPEKAYTAVLPVVCSRTWQRNE